METKAREFKFAEDVFIEGRFGSPFAKKYWDDLDEEFHSRSIHVIEYSAIEELQKRVQELEAENKKLRQALNFYADENNWNQSEAYAERLNITSADQRLLKGHYLIGGKIAFQALGEEKE